MKGGNNKDQSRNKQNREEKQQKISVKLSCSFLNKIDKPLAKLRKNEKTKTLKIKNKKGDITTEATEIKNIIRNY